MGIGVCDWVVLVVVVVDVDVLVVIGVVHRSVSAGVELVEVVAASTTAATRLVTNVSLHESLKSNPTSPLSLNVKSLHNSS